MQNLLQSQLCSCVAIGNLVSSIPMTFQQRILTLLIFFTPVACSSGNAPSSPAHQDEFVEAYIDLLRRSVDTSEARAENVKEILSSHGYTPEEFQAAVEYCNADPARWKPVLDEVVRRMEENQQRGVDPQKTGLAPSPREN